VTQPKPSKTARKKEQHELQQLGERLIDLPADELQALPLGERLRDAVVAATKIRSHQALRRQKQLIGKLMRNCDPGPIRHALDAREAEGRRAKRVFADAERWRDRIVNGGNDDLLAFCEHSGASSPVLADLLGQIRRAPSDRVEKSLRRQLFREIHDALAARAQDDRISR
jgi:ribosome-associated protein